MAFVVVMENDGAQITDMPWSKEYCENMIVELKQYWKEKGYYFSAKLNKEIKYKDIKVTVVEVP